jgi:hypothetical protein
MDIRLGVGLISRVELQPVSCGRGRSPSCPPGIAPLIFGVCLVGPGRLGDPALLVRPAESGLVVDLRAACRLFGARQDLGKRARRPVS